MDRFFKRPFYLLALACASLFYLPLKLRALWDPSESRCAEIAREMLELKDWVTLHLNYLPYFEKPPLAIWLTAFSMRLFGPTPAAARLVSATFGLLTVWATYRWGKNWKGERTGLLAGGILGTSFGFFALTQYVTLDMPLTFWTTMGLMAGCGVLVSGRRADLARRWSYVLALGLAGSFLTKGLAPVLLLMVTWLTVYVSYGRRIKLPAMPWKRALVFGMVLAAPWFILESLRHPLFPYVFFFQGHLQRYFTDLYHRAHPIYFYIPLLLTGFLPWVVFLPKVIRTWFSHRHTALQRDPEGAILVSWTCLVLIFFTLSRSKSPAYILPVFPALALLVAFEFDEALESADGLIPDWIGGGMSALIGILFLLLLALKLPPAVLAIHVPEWTVMVEQGGGLALILGFGVFILVGVSGMRQTLACIGGVMLVQVLLLTSAASFAPELDTYFSGREISTRFQMKAAAGDSIVGFGAAVKNRQSLGFYLGRQIPIVDEDVQLLTLPTGTWGVTDVERWQALRRNPSTDLFQLIHQAGNLVLFRKARS